MKTKNLLLISLILGLGLAAGAVLALSRAPTARAAGPWFVSLSGSDTTCLSWATACKTIQGALDKAGPGDTVNVAAGVYVENVYIAEDVIIQGAGAGSTFIDGSRSGPTIEMYQNHDLTISGVTVRNGYRSGNGGGIYVRRDCTVQVIDATIFDNVATGDGGGIHMDLLSTVTLSNTTVISNSASGYGGGISSAAPGGVLTIIDSTINENVASFIGGGIHQNAGTLTIEGSNVISNTAQQYGGGIAKSNGTMDIRKSVFAENASSSYGGGIYGSSCTVTIEDSTVRNNQLSGVGGRGGGIFSDAEMTLTSVTVSGNTSLDDGGGIHSQDPMTLTNVTVSGNTSGDGGGILHTGGSTMILRDCTIANNTIGAGGGPGGIRAYSPVSMRNSIIAGNESANCSVGGNLTSLGYNLESADTCGLNATGDKIDTDPLLGPLQDNGGTSVGLGEPTLTHALLPKSPAINAGDPAFSPPPDYDQRGVGFPRVLYGRVDIGAYEVTVILDQHVYLPLVLRD